MVDIKVKCGKCGAEVTPGYDFCLSCGTKFSDLPPKTKQRKGGGIVGEEGVGGDGGKGKYKRALIIGWFLVGIGVVLIVVGIIIGEYYTYGGLDEWGGMVLGGFSILSFPFFCFGVWYLVDSIRIKKRMKKPEENKKTELD